MTTGSPGIVRVNAVLTAKGLSAGHADRVIFSAADLVVPPGKVIGLVGANGAGKSALLRMLAGLDDGARCRVCVAEPGDAFQALADPQLGRQAQALWGAVARWWWALTVAVAVTVAVADPKIASRSRVRPAATRILTLTNPVTSSTPAGPCAAAGLGGSDAGHRGYQAPAQGSGFLR
jgi:ABC-type transporter Mla maintaining outer membrane lipid asymmetry ATPase subunit MlaF